MSGNNNLSNIALNPGILDSSIAPSNERETTFLRIDDIPSIDYEAKYFETIPTVWANAYAFERLLYQGDPSALEEWGSLFALHFFGVIGAVRFHSETLNEIYEPRLWEAVSGTYPRIGTQPLNHLDLLRSSDGTVVGGGYEETIFFPCRSRSWGSSKLMEPFIEGNRLSWKRCSDTLLQDVVQRQSLYDHLLRIAYYRVQGTLRERLIEFCRKAAVFRNVTERRRNQLVDIVKDPLDWNIAVDLRPESLLRSYPLRRKNEAGGYTYYLAKGMPVLSSWMFSAPTGKPTPLQYHQDPDKHGIIVELAKGPEWCPLAQCDQVVYLTSFFLNTEHDLTYFSKMPQKEARMLRQFHKHLVREGRGLFADLNGGDSAICLAPIRSELLKQFPELLKTPEDHIASSLITGGDGVESVEWTFKLKGVTDESLEVIWRSRPNYSKDFFISALSLWPPQVSPDWNLYVMRGQGRDTEASNFWHLIDESGDLGKFELLGQDSYVTILLASDKPSRPAALCLRDKKSAGQGESGILFLAEIPNKQIGNNYNAMFAVDFGTSNTCLAYKYSGDGARSQTDKLVRFSLTPLAIWEMGQRPDLPGFMPIAWGGEKGFFPTALLARTDFTSPDPKQIKPEHLFNVDIPTLHSKEMVDAWARGVFKDWTTHAESELKWNHGQNEPWRSLFLSLTLLYGQAELFFKEGLVVDNYVCTYPLSFTHRQREGFHDTTKSVIRNVRSLCYSQRFNPQEFKYHDSVNESIAVAAFIDANPQSTALDIFMDVGGGTTDIAVRYREDFLVLDSLRLAGRTFFRFSERNYEAASLPGSSEFKKYLYMLLTETKAIGPEWDRDALGNFDLATQYSVSINKVSDSHIESIEGRILDQKMGDRSFQRYRSQLFFRHLLTYALIQGCAAAISIGKTLDAKNQDLLSDGFHLILGGNAWGLLMFAEFQRSREDLRGQANKILTALKEILANHLTEADKPRIEKLNVTRLDLLNEEHLAAAKTAAALGALKVAGSPAKVASNLASYTGMNINHMKINMIDKPLQITWNERWSLKRMNELTGLDVEILNHLAITEPISMREPFDPLLSLFSRLGNPAQPSVDPLPGDEWERINAAIIKGEDYLDQGRLKYSPLQLLLTRILYPEKEIHARLEKLAEVTGHGKRKG